MRQGADGLYRKRDLPSLAKEGVAAHQEKWSEDTSGERERGGLFKRIVPWCLNKPPRLRRQSNGAIFLMAQPPLLCQGGEIRRSCKGYLSSVDKRGFVGQEEGVGIFLPAGQRKSNGRRWRRSAAARTARPA